MGKLGLMRDDGHKERLMQKYDALELAKALRDTWAERLKPDHPYLKHLEKRVQTIEKQLVNMRP